jgi:hypothetical protein
LETAGQEVFSMCREKEGKINVLAPGGVNSRISSNEALNAEKELKIQVTFSQKRKGGPTLHDLSQGIKIILNQTGKDLIWNK